MFEFLKYIQPLWSYRLILNTPNSMFFSKHYTADYADLLLDESFHTEEAKIMDRAYRALQRGIIPIGEVIQNKPENIQTVSNVFDNYLFVAKYFGRAKLTYILILRILALNNPINEIIAYIKSFKKNKIDFFDEHKIYDDFYGFCSSLIQQNTLVSIVIPTLNRYEYLKDVLRDLELQTYSNFEVLICDQTDEVNEEFYKAWKLNIRLFKQKDKALWLARNTCIRNANGKIVLLTEDDVLLPVDWVSNHLKCIDFFNCDISSGVFYPQGSEIPKNQSYFKLADHLATGNVCFRRDVFIKIGLFDRQFEKLRMGDGEYGLRALLNGLKSVSNPLSYCIDVKAPTGGLRQMGSWDSLRPTKLFAPRPVPSVLYVARKYFSNQDAFYYLIQNIPFSFIPYKYKRNKMVKIIFLFFLPFLLPLIFFVVIKSWLISSKILKEGSKIEFI